MTIRPTASAKLAPITLSGVDRAHVLDAIEDALLEAESEPIEDLISQGVVDKLYSSREILRDRHTRNT